jgi:TRAP-type transport system periplasmic protein
MRTHCVMAAVAAAALAATALVSSAGAQAPEIKLTFADQNSPTGWGPSNALYPWVKQVEAATKGRIKMEVFPSQTLVKGVDMWKSASAGTIDIGWCVQSYWPDLTPLSDVVSLPGLPFKTAEKGSEMFWKLYEKFPAIQKEFSNAKIQPLALYVTHPIPIMTSKKQIKSLDDLKGMKIRIVGGPATEQAKVLGMVPTPMPMPDVYQALDKGVIDGAGAVWEAVHSFRLYEVGKYYTKAPLATVYFSICANGLKGSIFWGKNFFDTVEAAVEAKAKEGGKEFVKYELAADENAKWVKLSEPIWEAWVKKMEDKGFKEAREILNTVLELSKS